MGGPAAKLYFIHGFFCMEVVTTPKVGIVSEASLFEAVEYIPQDQSSHQGKYLPVVGFLLARRGTSMICLNWCARFEMPPDRPPVTLLPEV